MDESLFRSRPRVIVGTDTGAAVLLVDQLRAAGCEVTTVRGAREALAAAAVDEPALLLLLARGLKGPAQQEAVRAFAQAHPRCPVLLLGREATCGLQQAVGAVGVIERPFAVAPAMERVRHALERARRAGACGRPAM